MDTAQYLDRVCGSLKTVRRVLGRYGDVSVGRYLAETAPVSQASLKDGGELAETVHRLGASVWGEETAEKAAASVENDPVILTANHLGVEYFAQSLQSIILMSLRKTANGGSPKYTPVFSFGNIPMNNLTYPRGMLLYDTADDTPKNLPFRLPVFPSRSSRRMAGHMPPYNPEMIGRLERRVSEMMRSGNISEDSARTVFTLLERDYLSPPALAAPDYSRQAAIVNRRLWSRMSAEKPPISELIYLEIEPVVTRLLKKDMADSGHLTACILFDGDLRESVLHHLNQIQGCWSRKSLSASEKPGAVSAHLRSGTVFFWGADRSGRRIPMNLAPRAGRAPNLEGTGDSGEVHSLPFTPSALSEALNDRRLIPSLFTCFLTLSFVRKCLCLGGYYQCEYLAAMKAGLTAALRETGGYGDAADAMKDVRTDGYLSGMLGVMTRSEKGRGLLPAGPVEIIRGGGLNRDDLERIRELTVRDVHIAGLFDTIPDIFPPSRRPANWVSRLSAECGSLLGGKIVVKDGG